MSGETEKKRVLVVEDNLRNLKLVRDVLRIAGFETIEANDGSRGIEIAREENPDLILMDIRMPVMDGFEALLHLKEDPKTNHIPVIALTASAMPNERERVLGHGFDGYIPKPVDIDELIKIVTDFISR
jgi:CheY-like chemotaxis protein